MALWRVLHFSLSMLKDHWRDLNKRIVLSVFKNSCPASWVGKTLYEAKMGSRSLTRKLVPLSKSDKNPGIGELIRCIKVLGCRTKLRLSHQIIRGPLGILKAEKEGWKIGRGST